VTYRAQIFMVSPKDFRPGVCALCAQPAILKFTDSVTGQSYGDCCFAAMVSAERALVGIPGIRPPERGDTQISGQTGK
jgi:hypothetical protein